MNTVPNKLNRGSLESDTTYYRPVQNLPEKVDMNSPAVDVMTDLKMVTAMGINPCATLDEATQRMTSSNVHLLFVTNQFNHVMGIITSNDLTGGKMVKYLKEVGDKRDEVMVRDLMTPQNMVDVLYMDEIDRSSVSDVVEVMKHMGRRHALVADRDFSGSQVICGVFSSVQISKQLGEEIVSSGMATNVADMALSS
ncbi:MAG: CBS domain-containing protein [Gammaproteobacteria bacterium]|nr:CBS domain-containing protein [Gammaproteobacteria bacterium]